EFSYEHGSLAGDPDPTDFRWHLLSLDLDRGIMNINLNGSYAWNDADGEKLQVRGQGARFYGYVFDDVGFSFNFIDYRESGNAINIAKTHTPDAGIILTRQTVNSIEYNTTEAQLTWQTGEFRFSIEKMQNVWGFGKNGPVILSRKAPSYPQVKMRVPLASWLDFIYVHADLNSNVLDSARSYRANSSDIIDFFRPVYRTKYMAAHAVEFTIVDGLDVSLGESVIYSDKGVQLIYVLPLMFFKSGEHYNRDTDNIQWFGSIDVTLIPNLNFYFSMLIDEINTDDLLRPGSSRNQLGYTAGVHAYDLPVQNVEVILEYTRLNPWAYTHKYPAATFTNNGYDLGHWVGQNGDDLYAEVMYQPMRTLKVSGFYEHYRKGGLKDVALQYSLPSQPFLYGPLHEERMLGLSASYQFVRDGFFNGRFRSRKISDESLPSLNRTLPEVSLSITYGIW
ncbi:MAG: hypothetical protein HYW57_00975, partial [Ignavibacteriales bacterium]|nr:hypothetical protein [Ignavibacteriales bacterium]